MTIATSKNRILKSGTGGYGTIHTDESYKMREILPQGRRYEHDQSDSPFPASLSQSFKNSFTRMT